MSSVIEHFLAIAQCHADEPALVSDDVVVSYQALSRRAACFARAIDCSMRETIGRDAGPGDVIGIAMDKEPDLYAAILAILAVGASYVPVDPALSPAQTAHILATSQCRLVVGRDTRLDTTSGVTRLSPTAVDMLSPEALRSLAHAPTRAGAEDLCYTIFTSGTTGRAKGVRIHHRNLLNLTSWAKTTFALGPASRVLQYSTINFDASVLDIFPTLLSGATLCIPNEEQRMSASLLANFCDRQRVGHAFLPPSLLAVLDAERFPSLNTVLTGGETCSPLALQSWLPGRQVYNLYGPTECTVLVSCKQLQTGVDPGNIGQAIMGARLHVLDQDLQPSDRGELYVAGECVSTGYVADPVTTAQRFVRYPSIDAGVLYKTGDIVRVDETGDLHFLGRVDRQVKVRGYRVELEEIESVLMKLGYAQVAVKPGRPGTLLAYVSPRLGRTAVDLRGELLAHLSDYKIPQSFVEMDCLPLKVSGKVAYDELPNVMESVEIEVDAPCLANDPIYDAILDIWAHTLKLPADSLHAQSDFRDAGGTSLGVVQLLGHIESRFGVRVPFIRFLKDPTPAFLFDTLRK